MGIKFKTICFCLAALCVLTAQSPALEGLGDPDPKQREKAARKLGEQADGYRYIDKLTPLLQDESVEVRAAVVASLIKFRSADALEPLMAATRDAAPEVQSPAVDGLVNFYYPDYVKFGWLNSIKTFAGQLKGRFSKPSPLVIEPYVSVNPDVIKTIGAVLSRTGAPETRANAARAIGVLRGRDALPALQLGVRSRNTMIMLESINAIKKIQDPAAGPDIVFLLRDLDEDVQFAVVQTVGQLRTKEAAPDLVNLIRDSDKARIRREALIALAKIPESNQRPLFQQYLGDKDKYLRAAAAEGLGRIGNPLDLGLIEQAFAADKAESARLSMAFALVNLGNLSKTDYLVDGLNSTVHRLEARPFLVELARKPDVLRRLYAPLASGSAPQRRHLAHVVAISGAEESLPHLRKLTEDGDDKVAVAAIEALKVLQARL